MTPNGSPRKKRRFSLWTLLAPVGLVVLVIAIFNALGEASCVFSECKKKDKGSESTSEKPANLPPGGKRHRVRTGDTVASIAEKYGLTEQGFMKCNPNITDSYVLHVGDSVAVGATCRKHSAQLGESPNA